MATCFPNVIVPDEELKILRSGHNMSSAHLTCMKYLLTKPWKYVILLQTHDMLLKTNRELVEILTVYNGTNDVDSAMREHSIVE